MKTPPTVVGAERKHATWWEVAGYVTRVVEVLLVLFILACALAIWSIE